MRRKIAVATIETCFYVRSADFLFRDPVVGRLTAPGIDGVSVFAKARQ